MNREELMTLLPHRDGMLLLDQLDKEGRSPTGSIMSGGTSGSCRATSRMPPWSPA